MSLYNETDGRGVLPTPVLGVVGLLEDAEKVVRRAFRAEGDAIVLLGTTRTELGGSEYLKVIHGLIRGTPPALDLTREAALQRLLVARVADGLIRSAHDCSEGGVAVALAECCFTTGFGAAVDVARVEAPALEFDAIYALFSESASRVIVSVEAARSAELVRSAGKSGVPASIIGRVGGERIRIAISGVSAIDQDLAEAERIWSDAIGNYFNGQRAIA